jgi:hypothetical protein
MADTKKVKIGAVCIDCDKPITGYSAANFTNEKAVVTCQHADGSPDCVKQVLLIDWSLYQNKTTACEFVMSSATR